MRGTFLTAATISATPLFALLLLAVSGAAATGPVLLAMAATMTAAIGLVLLWTRDLALVLPTLRRAAEGNAVPTPDPAFFRFPALTDFTREAARLLRAQNARAVRAEEERRAEQVILEVLPDPLITLDAELRLRRINMAARRDFGTEAAAILRHPTLRATIDRALAEDTPQTAELILPVPVSRDLLATITPLDAIPNGDRLVILLTDHTREQAVERMRADFVANASHELRTPLASLIGFIETLCGPAADDPAAQRRFLDIMALQAARMNRLIDDLLGLSRIELAEHQQPAGRVDLAELAEQVTAGFEPSLHDWKATLETAIGPGLPCVIGDADQLAQVLQNLLDNALKHGREGVGIRLTAAPARAHERWPARPGIVLTVADTGPGIAREHLPRLTERFYRVDASRSRAVGSTGLGLAIVKHIVNRHRGQLRIESTVGAGTSFHIWLPTA